MNEIRGALEAILFVAEVPVSDTELAEVLEVPRADVAEMLAALRDEFEERSGGIILREIGGGWRFYTAPEARPYLEQFAASDKATRLSNAALESLAVVAYKQPVSRGQVSEIRGVGAAHPAAPRPRPRDRPCAGTRSGAAVRNDRAVAGEAGHQRGR